MRGDLRPIERPHLQAKMVHVAALLARRSAPHLTQLARDLDKIDQRRAGPQLDQADRILDLLDPAAEHVAIEALHACHVAHPQHDMVDGLDGKGRSVRHPLAPLTYMRSRSRYHVMASASVGVRRRLPPKKVVGGSLAKTWSRSAVPAIASATTLPAIPVSATPMPE